MVGLSGNAALAHPELQSTEPAAGSATVTSPQQIRITFSEAVIPQFSGVELKDQAGKLIATGKAAVDPAKDPAMLKQVKVVDQVLFEAGHVNGEIAVTSLQKAK